MNRQLLAAPGLWSQPWGDGREPGNRCRQSDQKQGDPGGDVNSAKQPQEAAPVKALHTVTLQNGLKQLRAASQPSCLKMPDNSHIPITSWSSTGNTRNGRQDHRFLFTAGTVRGSCPLSTTAAKSRMPNVFSTMSFADVLCLVLIPLSSPRLIWHPVPGKVLTGQEAFVRIGSIARKGAKKPFGSDPVDQSSSSRTVGMVHRFFSSSIIAQPWLS